MQTLWQDLRYGARMLLKKPGFTVIAVMTLALGIGANSTIFSIVNAVLLRPLPYQEPDRLVVALHGGTDPVSPADFRAWREQARVFEHMTAAEFWTPNLTGRDRPEQLWAVRATDGLFTLLGVPPMLGRTFSSGEDQPGAAPVVVLGHGLWQRRFGGDPRVVGQTLTLDGQGYTVIGVMPPGFEFPLFWATKAEMWAPLSLANRMDSHGRSLRVFARLRPGVAGKQAQAEMDIIAERLAQAYPETNAALGVTVVALHRKVVGDVRPTLLVLLGAVGLVLMIACANVANLMLARAGARQKEIAVRLALGATRPRLVRQLLTESSLLAVLGDGAGLLLALWGVSLFAACLPEDMLPRQQAIGMDGGALGFTLLLSLVTAMIFGLVPALQASRPDLNESLKEGGRHAAGDARGQGLRGLLVVSEVALALALLVGAGLLIRSFVRLQAVDPGFDPTNVLAVTISVAGTKHAPSPQRVTFFEQVLERARALPGVEFVSAVNHLPLAGDIWRWPFSIEGRPAPPPGQRPSAAYRVACPGYFHTLGIRLLSGRDFNERDTQRTPGVVIINETMARRHWPGEEIIGKRIKLGSVESNNPWLAIVGVVKDVKQREWVAEAGSEMYLPYLQSVNYLSNPAPHFSYLTLVVRTTTDPAGLAAAVRDTVWAIEPNAPVSGVATMEQVIAGKMWRPRFSMLLLGGFALAALVLAALGIYGVVSYSVARRTHEVGIRMALGAQPRDVFRLVVGQGMKLALIGAMIGLAASLALTRWMESLLFGVSATDPLTFAAVAMLLMAVALLACYVPARRATRVDPMVALRYE